MTRKHYSFLVVVRIMRFYGRGMFMEFRLKMKLGNVCTLYLTMWMIGKCGYARPMCSQETTLRAEPIFFEIIIIII